jgi:hypothetical protein
VKRDETDNSSEHCDQATSNWGCLVLKSLKAGEVPCDMDRVIESFVDHDQGSKKRSEEGVEIGVITIVATETHSDGDRDQSFSKVVTHFVEENPSR